MTRLEGETGGLTGLRPVRRTVVVAVALGLCVAGPALAETGGPSASKSVNEHTSEYVRDYLSDPRRVGTLAGSILGGALTAHPAGTVVGSLVGFFIGKQSMFNEDDVRREQQQTLLARRSIVPPDGGGDVQPLSFAASHGVGGGASQAQAFPVLSASSMAQPTVPFSPIPAATPGVSLPLAHPAPTGLSREQIAALCGNGARAVDTRLRSLCFYHHTS